MFRWSGRPRAAAVVEVGLLGENPTGRWFFMDFLIGLAWLVAVLVKPTSVTKNPEAFLWRASMMTFGSQALVKGSLLTGSSWTVLTVLDNWLELVKKSIWAVWTLGVSLLTVFIVSLMLEMLLGTGLDMLAIRCNLALFVSALVGPTFWKALVDVKQCRTDLIAAGLCGLALGAFIPLKWAVGDSRDWWKTFPYGSLVGLLLGWGVGNLWTVICLVVEKDAGD